MSRRLLNDQQPSCAGGINTVSSASSLSENQLRRAENARLTEFGAIKKRGGTQRIFVNQLADGAEVQGGFMWRKDSGDKSMLIVAGGSLFVAPISTIPMTPSPQVGVLASTGQPSFAKFRDAGGNDVVYIGDGGQLNKWDGTTLTTDISPVNTRSIAVHNERLWSCGCGSSPQSIFYSDLNNGDTLGDPSANGGEIVIRTFGDQITQGVMSLGSSLLVFHRRGISRLTGYGEDDIVASPDAITGDIGVVAPLSIVEYNNIGYFISDRGLYICNEDSVQRVGNPERPDPLQPILRGMTEEELDKVVAVMNEATQEFTVFLPGEGAYTYNTILNAWAGPFTGGYTSPSTTALFMSMDFNDIPQLYKGDAEGWVVQCDVPQVYKDNVSADGSELSATVVNMSVQFRRMYFGTRSLAKTFRWGYLTADLSGSDSTTVRWSSQLGSGVYNLPATSSSVWGSGEWGSGSWGGGELSFRIPMSGKGYYIDTTVIDTSSTGLPSISSFDFEAYLLGRR